MVYLKKNIIFMLLFICIFICAADTMVTAGEDGPLPGNYSLKHEGLLAARRPSRRTYRRYAPVKKDTIYFNLEGSLGIGFYQVPSGAIKGGMNLTADAVILDFDFINMGFSAGLLSVMSSRVKTTEEQPNDPITGQPVDPVTKTATTDINAFPLNFMIIKYIKYREWNSVPYIHLSPGMYFLRETVNDSGKFRYGYGSAAGLGLLIPISQSLYVDLGTRLHWFMDSFTAVPRGFTDAKYTILTSSIGVCYKW